MDLGFCILSIFKNFVGDVIIFHPLLDSYVTML